MICVDNDLLCTKLIPKGSIVPDQIPKQLMWLQWTEKVKPQTNDKKDH